MPGPPKFSSDEEDGARGTHTQGLLDLAPIERPCGVCMARKQKRTSFPEHTQYRADKVPELMHGHLCGKLSPLTLAGNQYFLLIVDDKSCFMSIVMLPLKDQALKAIKRF
jgi:hypothetical protein